MKPLAAAGSPCVGDGDVSLLVSHGSGPCVWDRAGNRYLDLTGSSGTNLLGHREPHTTLAAVAALAEGPALVDGASEDELVVGETLSRLYAASGVQFFRTGSCATSAAVRLMRIASGKDLVVTSGYHGWHDWVTERAHYPEIGRVTDFGYDLHALEDILRRHDVAGIIVTYLPHTLASEYWQELRELAARAGVLLTVDEIKTGIRYGLGGMVTNIGVRPDLTVLSKGLTNGLALSAVLDHGTVLRHATSTNLGGTYRTERGPFAAARAMLAFLEGNPSVFRHVSRMTELFVEGMAAALRDGRFAAGVFGQAGDIEFVCESPQLWDRLRVEGLRAGLHLPDDGNIMLSAAHQPQDIHFAIDALLSALAKCDDTPLLTWAASMSGTGRRVSEEAWHRHSGVRPREIADWGTPGARAVLG